VAVLRSQRLEALLGASLDQLAESTIAGLVTEQVPEDADLDYKSVLYGNKDSDKRDLAGDVAAMANAAGGILILGIEEDEHARAVAAPGIVLSDAEVRRMTQVVAGLTVPMPQFDIFSVPSAASPDHGWYVIVVARSPLAPHAVTVNEGLRYPVRNGTTTRYLTEPEVAAAYRRRALGDRDLTERLDAVARTGKTSLDPAIPWIYMTATPELRGDMQMTREVYEAFRARHQSRSSIFDHNLHFMKFGVGRHRWSTHGGTDWGDGSAKYVAMDLHADGSLFFARQLWDIRNSSATADVIDVISDEAIVATVVEGLVRFGRHVHESAAGGQAAIVATLSAAHERQITIGNGRSFGFGQSASTVVEGQDVTSSVVYSAADDLAIPGSGLMQTAGLLANELGQSFGIVDLGLINESGGLLAGNWFGGAQSSVVVWARTQPNIHVV
jgi:hypothetical protein